MFTKLWFYTYILTLMINIYYLYHFLDQFQFCFLVNKCKSYIFENELKNSDDAKKRLCWQQSTIHFQSESPSSINITLNLIWILWEQLYLFLYDSRRFSKFHIKISKYISIRLQSSLNEFYSNVLQRSNVRKI